MLHLINVYLKKTNIINIKKITRVFSKPLFCILRNEKKRVKYASKNGI